MSEVFKSHCSTSKPLDEWTMNCSNWLGLNYRAARTVDLLLFYIFIIVTGNTFHIYIYKFQILFTNYKHTQPTLGLSVTFVFNIEYIEGLAQNYCIYNFKIFQEIEKTAQFSWNMFSWTCISYIDILVHKKYRYNSVVTVKWWFVILLTFLDLQ